MRAVLDPNVLVAALLSRSGAPAKLLARWLSGEFELVVSRSLLTELERALRYPKVRARVAARDAAAFVELLRRSALVVTDPPDPPRRAPDPGDDHLLALAEVAGALLVSGDAHLLGLVGRFPVRAPRCFLEELPG